MTTVHDFTLKTIDGREQPLREYAGKVLVLVNVASKCGLTPHYEGLEALYRQYKTRGLAVLGVPCNDFGAQEPGTEAEIQTFCQSRYDVSFPMFSKVHVKGPEQDALYAFLTAQKTAPDGAGDIGWNFAKFVIGKDGQVVARFAPTTTPEAPEVVAAIDKALGMSRYSTSACGYSNRDRVHCTRCSSHASCVLGSAKAAAPAKLLTRGRSRSSSAMHAPMASASRHFTRFTGAPAWPSSR